MGRLRSGTLGDSPQATGDRSQNPDQVSSKPLSPFNKDHLQLRWTLGQGPSSEGPGEDGEADRTGTGPCALVHVPALL